MHSEVDHIIEAFKTWDEAGTGLISKENLSTIIRALSPGIGDADLDKLFTAAAGDGMAGDIFKYEDFVAWLWLPSPADKGAKAGGKGTSAKKPARSMEQAPAASSSAPAPPAFDAAEEERRRRGLWQGALQDAIQKGSGRYPEGKVRQYFDQVQVRLAGEEYVAHVRGVVFQQVDSDQDGKVSFKQVSSIIGKSLQCVNDMGSGEKVTIQDIRHAFDAHDTLQIGRGVMGTDEFLNLMRYLQVCVAEAVMPMSKLLKES